MSILNTGTSNYSDDDFLSYGRGIVAALNNPPGSTYFPAVVPSQNDLHDLLDTFELAIQQGNAPGAAEDRDVSRAAAAQMMVAMAINLENTSRDREKLAHTGYTLRKIPEHNSAPTGTPQDARVRPTGIPGEAKLDCDGVTDVLNYEYQWTHDPTAGPWMPGSIVPNIRSMLLTGLERGKDTWFRIRAYGPNGPGPWSDPATMMVT